MVRVRVVAVRCTLLLLLLLLHCDGVTLLMHGLGKPDTLDPSSKVVLLQLLQHDHVIYTSQ